MKYCLPLLCKTTQEVEMRLELHDGASFAHFEIWLEYIEDASSEWIKKVAEKWGHRLIFLFRRLKLEPVRLTTKQRREWMLMIAATSSCVDFDLATQERDVEHWLSIATDGRERLLLSVHNYEQMPETSDLHRLLDQMATFRPWICKLAMMCQTRGDALRLLSLFTWFPEQYPQRPFLFLGMGEHGLVTRVFGPMWGNEMTFAPIQQAESSAPGQLIYEQYEDIFSILAGEK